MGVLGEVICLQLVSAVGGTWRCPLFSIQSQRQSHAVWGWLGWVEVLLLEDALECSTAQAFYMRKHQKLGVGGKG